MKVRLYIITAVLLVAGALLYSSGVFADFGPDPLLAGARAARPNGVPSCLFPCEHEQPGDREVNDNEVAEHEGKVDDTAGEEARERAAQHRITVHQTSIGKANAQAIASAQARNKAHASAVAIASHVTVHPRVVVSPQQQVVVQRRVVVVHKHPVVVQKRVVVVHKRQVVAARRQPAREPDNDEQPRTVVAASQAVPTITPAPVTIAHPATSTPLPATGPVAFSGALGTAAIIGAAWYYVRSRRGVIQASKSNF